MEIGIIVSHGVWMLRSRHQSDSMQRTCPERKLSVMSSTSCMTSEDPEGDIEKQEK
jgi:hypothetical protein